MRSSGVFAEWQPRYAERGIATFPVRGKKPSVNGYLKIGLRASGQFVLKFPKAEAFGLSCRRNGISVLDVDSPDERLLADAMNDLGQSPFIVRSGSGNYQAWYRNNGEKRRIRRDPTKPIDILGDGFVVAPPSVGSKGQYCIIQGSLDDLSALPCMRTPAAEVSKRPELVREGQRNDHLWRECMKQAPHCKGFEQLMEFAALQNSLIFEVPLGAHEVVSVARSAWQKEASNSNFIARGGGITFRADDVDDLLMSNADAFMLLAILKRWHWGRSFVVANAMASSMPEGGWTVKRLAAARKALGELGIIEVVRERTHRTPAEYKFKVVKND